MSTTFTAVQPTGIAADPFAELREAVTGRLVTPADPDYDRARTPWLVNVEQRPAAVLEVADPADVVAAVQWARRHGLAVAAQPSGHAPRSVLDGALLLRTRALQGIEVDAETKLATVGAGVKFGELCAALDDTGLMALAGSNADPTVVGLSLGGGVSWFTRKHGFTANSVVAFDAVDADGRLVHVTAESDPELFWALRGGGGDFAVVVSATLRLFDAPEMYGGQLLWPVEHAGAVLRAFRDLSRVAPRELTLWAHVLHFPDVEMVPEPMRGRSFVNVAATYLGSPKMAEILLWSLREAAPVELDLMRPFRPSQLTDVAAEPSDPMPGLEHSLLLTGPGRPRHRRPGRRGLRPGPQPAPARTDPGPGWRVRRRRPPATGAVRPVPRVVPAVRPRHARRPRAGGPDRGVVRGHRRGRGPARQRPADAQLRRQAPGRQRRLRVGDPGPAAGHQAPA